MESCYPSADAYRQLVSATIRTVREHRRAEVFAYTERHLKCVWFDDAIRPALLRSERGDDVVVEYAGRWNLEAGPDFLGAALRVGPDRRRLTGDVEIHVHPADWHRHGHAQDPAYSHVIAHVTYFPGFLPADSLPAASAQMALKASLAANPCFSFESLDITAYPYAQRASAPPCAQILSSWNPDAWVALFEAAGEDRLRRKAERLATAIEEKGRDQILYEELMSAFGYKHNRTPFRTLADRLPLAALRDTAGGDVTAAYALLMGVAGLLPAQTDSRWDPETRAFVRQLWNRWWKFQAQWRQVTLLLSAWKLGGIRPQNHPRRRLMAAAFLFTQAIPPTERLLALHAEKTEDWLDRVTAWLQPTANTYWRYRLALGGPRRPAAVSLLGARRTAGILSNVILPFLAALDASAFPGRDILRRLPPEEDNSIVRQAAHNLLGPDHNPKLYRTGLRQQGLIQIFHDFCLNDRSRCADCPLFRNLASFPQIS